MRSGRVSDRVAESTEPVQVRVRGFEPTATPPLVYVVSDDRVWARLLAANLQARGVSSRIGDSVPPVDWFETTEATFGEQPNLIVDFGTYQVLLKDYYAAMIERIRPVRDQVIAIVNNGWTRRTRQQLPAAVVLRRHRDMRRMVPDVLKALDRDEPTGE